MDENISQGSKNLFHSNEALNFDKMKIWIKKKSDDILEFIVG
jgi:hypothetical protein